MSENTLITRIKEEAAAEVAAKKAEGEAAVAAVKRETDAQVAAMKAEHERELAKKLSHLELVAVSKTKQAAKIAYQEAKRTMINELFAEVDSKLIKQSSEEYVSFFAQHAAKIVPAGLTGVTVEAPQERTAETQAIMDQLKMSGTVVAGPAISAGFMVSATDGVYDVTLARLLEEQRPELEMRVVAALAQ